MKANELMVGDWVYMEAHRGYEAQYIQVETIPDASSKDHYGHIGAFPIGGDNDFRDIEDRHLFPIPLTPEILEKNGFKFEYGAAWNLYRFSVPWFVLYKKEYGLMLNIGQIEIPISFVHRLQHALRLCGIEKEIEL